MSTRCYFWRTRNRAHKKSVPRRPDAYGYRDVNVNLVYHGLVVELQKATSQQAAIWITSIAAARGGAGTGPDGRPREARLCVPIGDRRARRDDLLANVARLVIALLSLFVAVLYLDVFTLKGLRLFVRRADPTRGAVFEQPFVVHRFYGIALAAPYLANVYMLMRAAGLFGEAAKDARTRTDAHRPALRKILWLRGPHFVWKVFCFQTAEVALQAAGKIPLLGYTWERKAEIWRFGSCTSSSSP